MKINDCWSDDLYTALDSGDPGLMKAMLARVPGEVIRKAAPYLKQLAIRSRNDDKFSDALVYYDQLVRAMPEQTDVLFERALIFIELDRLDEALQDADRIIKLEPDSGLGYRLCGNAYHALGDLERALAAYLKALSIEPADRVVEEHIRYLEARIDRGAVPHDKSDGQTAQGGKSIGGTEEMPQPPKWSFDPLLLSDPSIPDTTDQTVLEAVRKHLKRYSSQRSPGNVITRLEDPVWLNAWDNALSSAQGSSCLFLGSELGVLALAARKHNATNVLSVEPYPLDARISSGIVQKNLLSEWHGIHGTAIHEWSEDERRESFQAFTSGIDIITTENEIPDQHAYDLVVFPRIDHSLLGTGILKTIREYRANMHPGHLRVLPSKASVFAMAIQWLYPFSSFDLRPINRLRWSPYPDPLQLDETFWNALTDPVKVCEIDFDSFEESHWEIAMPVTSDGGVNAIVFWFDLTLGEATITNAPGSDLRCLPPAVQYTDSIDVRAGQTLPIRVEAHETRLFFRTQPPSVQARSGILPNWYVSMLGDRYRNTAYYAAIKSATDSQPASTVLDIGAGVGLLSMVAAKAGAQKVVACEFLPEISNNGKDIIECNRLDDRVTLINKDCRTLNVPNDLPHPADVAVFETFDCSLIGEGVLHYLAHAREHLLAKSAQYIPASGRIRAMVIEYRLDKLLDIDVNLLNPYRASPTFINVDATNLDYRPISDPFDVFLFDFSTAGPEAASKDISIPAITEGIAGAVLFWFDLQLDESTSISNAPTSGKACHWQQGLQFLPEIKAESAANLPLIAMHNGSSLEFRWRQEELDKEMISRLPCFDPHWLALSNELDQQTQQLRQHCSQNLEEYVKVIDIAKRLATDPAAHELDPVIAQRFMSMWMGN